MKWKLIRPAGFAEDQIPLFSDGRPGPDRPISRSSSELGYGLEEIQKIIKKFGLPQRKTGKKAAPRKRTAYLTVGDLAERSGVSPRTIKHWEDKGIIEPDMRTEGGFRLYSEAYVFSASSSATFSSSAIPSKRSKPSRTISATSWPSRPISTCSPRPTSRPSSRPCSTKSRRFTKR